MIAAIFSIIAFACFTIFIFARWVGDLVTEISSDTIALTIIWWVMLIILNNTLWSF